MTERNHAADLPEEIRDLVGRGDGEALRNLFESMPTGERIHAMSRMSTGELISAFKLLEPSYAAGLVRELPESRADELLANMDAPSAALIVDQMPSDRQADRLGSLEINVREPILAQMLSQEFKHVRELLDYPPNSAGGLMNTECLRYIADQTVDEVFTDLQMHGERYSDYNVQYAYICDPDDRLAGVLRMRDLFFARRDARVGDLMIGNPTSVGVDSSLDNLVRFFTEHQYLGVPVVDQAGRLVGVVRRASVSEAAGRQANKSFLEMAGIIGGEELRSMPLRVRAGRRLSWLSLNILLNIVAASVIAVYTGTLEQVIALAVFLPIISDMSGCSGNQAVAVSIRELTLGVLKPTEFLRVFMKESAIGLINGTVLGLLIAVIAWLWKGNPWLGLVVGLALGLNTLIAVCFGGLVPVVLKRLRLDPALVSGPLLTTVTDMCGFFLVLSLAAFALQHVSLL